MPRTYSPACDGWSNEKSSLHKETVDGQVRYRGVYMVGSIPVWFRLNSQSGSEGAHYLWRGTCSIHGADGYILQVEGDARRKVEKRLAEKDPGHVPGARREELNASMALHCQFTDEKDIRVYIAKSATKLCDKHLDAIRMDGMRSGKMGEATLLDAWTMLQTKFMKTYAKRTMEYQNTICQGVRKVCAALSRLPVDRITPAMVSRYAADMDSKAVRQDIEFVSKFWAFCRRQRFCTADNPFAEWLERNRKDARVRASAALTNASAVSAFSQEQEVQLYASIREHWQEGRYRALLLALENGLSARELSRLQVKHLIFRDAPPRVQICRRKGHLHSATHNYTVPASPFCAYILALWHQELIARYPGKSLENHFVCGDGTTALDIKTIQNFCRWMLTKAGVSGSNSPGKRQPTFAILRENYRHRLLTYCGLRDEPGAVAFLMGDSMADDTTSDHYRNFTDEEGQRMLYRALARDRRFYAEPMPVLPEGIPGKELWVVPAAPEERSVISATIQVKAGDIITVESPMGVQVSWRSEKLS